MDTLLHNKALINVLSPLSEFGNKVTLISIKSKDLYYQKKQQFCMCALPLRYVPIVTSIMFAIIISIYLPIKILKYKPDRLILSPDVSVFTVLPTLVFKKRTKFVLDIRSTPVETSGYRGFLVKFWFSASVLVAKKCFSGFTVLTNMMKLEVCHEFSIAPAKVGVWSSGVSVEVFDPKRVFGLATKLRHKLALNDKFVVFYHGIFTANRGLIQTIDAIQEISTFNTNIVFFLLGTGPLTAHLKTLIEERALQQSIIIHEPVDQTQVPVFIAMSDVCIVPLPDHPYWRCQSPLKLLEYLAMEKAVILTDIPAHREVIGDEHCAIFISSINPLAIIDAIGFVHNNKENLVEWGKIGREIIKRNYTWQKIGQDLERCLLVMN
jgi:glycosyltransferase involved in cell wall biosynthesis